MQTESDSEHRLSRRADRLITLRDLLGHASGMPNASLLELPAGGLLSTARDVTQFCRRVFRSGTLDRRQYLSPQSLGEMNRRQTPASADTSYGLGWEVDGRRYYHSGAAGSTLMIDPARGTAIVYMFKNVGVLDGEIKAPDTLTEAVFHGRTNALIVRP